jgi:hypothetical protein
MKGGDPFSLAFVPTVSISAKWRQHSIRGSKERSRMKSHWYLFINICSKVEAMYQNCSMRSL